MPTYDVTSPDGKTFEVTAPEGATQDQVLAYAKQQFSAQAAPAAAPQQDEGVMSGVASQMRGLRAGLHRIPQSAAELVARGTDAAGISNGAYPMLHEMFTKDNASYMGDSGNAKVGDVAGQVIGTLPAMGLKVPGLASKLPTVAKVVNGALQGGAAAGMTSSASDAPLTSQLAMGAAFGGGLPLLAAGAGRVISPKTAPAAKALLDRNIPLTPGQILGGAWKGAEDKLTSVPLVGDLIKHGQKNSVVGLNKAAYEDALAPLGVKLPANVEPGREGVDFVQKQISDRYDSILPQMTGSLDQQFTQAVNQAAAKLKAEGVTNETIDRFKNVVQAQLIERSSNGAFQGSTLKGIQSDLGRISTKHGTSADSSDRALGEALGDVQTAFNDMLLRNNPQFAKPLQEANAAWAQYVRIRRAASSVGSKDGVFSPAQYANAVKATDKSVGKGAYARGKALQQDLSDPANQVLPSTIPNSGTTDRLLLAGLGMGAPTYFSPLAGAAGVGLAGLYTKPGQKLAALALSKRPASAPSIATAVNKFGALGAPLAPLLLATEQ